MPWLHFYEEKKISQKIEIVLFMLGLAHILLATASISHATISLSPAQLLGSADRRDCITSRAGS